MSVETWKSIRDTGTLVALFLAFAFGLAWFTGKIINERQAEKIRLFDNDLRDKQLKIVEAQRGLAEANRAVADANRIAEGEKLERLNSKSICFGKDQETLSFEPREDCSSNDLGTSAGKDI